MSLASDEFNEKTRNYLAWAKDNAIDISSKITIHDYTLQDQGRGVIALEDISEGEVIATIPKSILLNVTQNSLITKYPHLQYKLLHLDHWDALIIILLYELQCEIESKWKAYLQVLPRQNFNQLIFWSDDELNSLQPSFILDRVGKDSAMKMFERISKVINELGIKELENVCFEKYNVVATLIMSYSFDVETTEEEEAKIEEKLLGGRTGEEKEEEEMDKDDEEKEEEEMDKDVEEMEQVAIISDGYIKSMVPFADVLNADTNYNNAIVSDSDDNLIITTIKPIRKGDQVYNTYSEHPNCEILRRYGYVELEGSKFDFGEIPLSTIKQFFVQKYSISEKDLNSLVVCISVISSQERMDEHSEDGTFDIVIESYDCFKSGEVIIELILFLQLLTTFLLLDETKVEPSIVRKVYQLIGSEKVTHEMVENLGEIISSRLEEYPDFASEAFETNISKLNRETMAKIALKSEYQSLALCKEDIKGNIEKTLGAPIKIISDEKFIRAIKKKRQPPEDTSAMKKQKKNS
ncbi:RKM4 [Candida oxycetoniae]|uniref:Ribosomal lysine N-methyltransferase 4 n=1 Tax=Candida oxycetoniae TaxID=497107 RepID=A0AAI9SV16_9ASCO|nr:RKM4 [Candida oxycetoniae]KAI3403349.2 RKM4 [Candida oxycetoniae]